MNLNMTVGQAACQLLRRYAQTTLAASCVIVPIVTCESGKRTYASLCLKCTWSKLKVVLQIRAMCRASSIILQ